MVDGYLADSQLWDRLAQFNRGDYRLMTLQANGCTIMGKRTFEEIRFKM